MQICCLTADRDVHTPRTSDKITAGREYHVTYQLTDCDPDVAATALHHIRLVGLAYTCTC